MLIPYEWREETRKQVKSIISLPRQSYKYSSLFFLEICCRTSTSAVSVHRKAASAAAGLRLPVTLAVACYIIYAVLDLMEHMCVCGWHSSQIKWNGVRAHIRLSRRSECEAQTGLWRKPYHSSVCTHTQPCTYLIYACIYTLWRPHAVRTACTQQRVPTNIRRSIKQNMALLPARRRLPPRLTSAHCWHNSAHDTAHEIPSVLLGKYSGSEQSDSQQRWSDSQFQRVNQFFSGLHTLF